MDHDGNIQTKLTRLPELIIAELRKTSVLCSNCHRSKSLHRFRQASLDRIEANERAIIGDGDDDAHVATALFNYLEQRVWPLANLGGLGDAAQPFSVCAMTNIALEFLKAYDDALTFRGAEAVPPVEYPYPRAFGRRVAATVPLGQFPAADRFVK